MSEYLVESYRRHGTDRALWHAMRCEMLASGELDDLWDATRGRWTQWFERWGEIWHCVEGRQHEPCFTSTSLVMEFDVAGAMERHDQITGRRPHGVFSELADRLGEILIDPLTYISTPTPKANDGE